MPSVSLLSLDDDTLSYLLSTLEAPDLARSCCTSRALKQLVDREWADENKEKHSLWERHCQAIRLRRLKRHRSWKRAWLESRCHRPPTRGLAFRVPAALPVPRGRQAGRWCQGLYWPTPSSACAVPFGSTMGPCPELSLMTQDT